MSGSTLDFSGFAPAMSPGQAGIGGFVAPTVDDPLTSSSQTGNIGGGINAAGIAKALQSLQTGLQGAGGGQQQAAHAGTPSGTAASGTGQGSSAGIANLVNMLLQRQNQYFPGQPNRQPVTQSRTAGLLGF